MAYVRVTPELLAELVQESWPWPEGTTLEYPSDELEGTCHWVTFAIESPELDGHDGEVTPIFTTGNIDEEGAPVIGWGGWGI